MHVLLTQIFRSSYFLLSCDLVFQFLPIRNLHSGRGDFLKLSDASGIFYFLKKI